MAELFEVKEGSTAQHINEFPFQDEINDLESFIKENPQVISEGLEIFDEQVDTRVSGRIDLLALDKTAGTAQITLIELKNEIAQQPVLLQTLRYASWIKNNPDSIRYLLEKKRLAVKDIDFNPIDYYDYQRRSDSFRDDYFNISFGTYYRLSSCYFYLYTQKT